VNLLDTISATLLQAGQELINKPVALKVGGSSKPFATIRRIDASGIWVHVIGSDTTMLYDHNELSLLVEDL
jgi:hypothetical protein